MAAVSVQKIGDSIVDAKSLNLGEEKYGEVRFGNKINGCSFQQDAMVSHAGHQYVAYYDGDRQVCLARRKLPLGKWEIIRFDDYAFKSNDSHNTISIGISPADGMIYLAFDHHVDALHYRVSKNGAAAHPEKNEWEASLFGPILSRLEKNKEIKISYPRFWKTPEGGLQFFYRLKGSGNGTRMLVDYNSRKSRWLNTRQIMTSCMLTAKIMGRCGSTAVRRYYHYFRKADGTWETRVLSGVGASRPKVFIDKADNAYLIFPKSGKLIIMGGQASASWKDWKVIHTEPSSFHSEMLGDFLPMEELWRSLDHGAGSAKERS